MQLKTYKNQKKIAFQRKKMELHRYFCSLV
jgi:hypothetical protein